MNYNNSIFVNGEYLASYTEKLLKLIIDNKSILLTKEEILFAAPENISEAVNNELLLAYWNIGRVIIAYEQAGANEAVYGKILCCLSKTTDTVC